MKTLFSFYRVELRRLSRAGLVRLICLLAAVAPVFGYFIVGVEIVSNQYIAFPVSVGCAAGGVLFAFLAILEADRVHRSGADVLTDAVAAPATLGAARMLALITIAAVTAVVTALAHFPFALYKMEYLFKADFYFLNYALLLLPAWWISILMADTCYRLTQRIELSVLLFTAIAFFATVFSLQGNYFTAWLYPHITTYSDGFTSYWHLRVNFYTRMIWFCCVAGCWLISLLFVRKYQRGLFFSFAKARRKRLVLLPAACLLVAGGLLAYYQPFVDHGPSEYVDEDFYLQDSPSGSFQSAHLDLKVHPMLGSISATVTLNQLHPVSGETRFELNPGYQIKRITYDGEEISFRTEKKDVNGRRTTYFELPQKEGKTLVITYGGIPTQPRYCKGFNVFDTVDWDYIFLQDVALIPMLYDYTGDNITSSYTIPEGLVPYLDNVQPVNYKDNGDGTRTWEGYGYITSLIAGDYMSESVRLDDMTLEFSYGASYQAVVKKFDVISTIRDIFQYCGSHYGMLTSTSNGHLLLQQQSSAILGGWAGEGFSQWFEQVLSPDTLKDTERGSSANEVFIHEMVHQWWGGLGLCCKNDELWSEEGLTVYSTYRIVKELYGEAYAKQYYVDKWQEAVKQQERNFYNRHPEYLTLLPDNFQALIREQNTSANHYSRMPLMILKAEKLLGGEEKMDAVLRQMYADKDNFLGYDEDSGFRYEDFLAYTGLTKEDLELE